MALYMLAAVVTASAASGGGGGGATAGRGAACVDEVDCELNGECHSGTCSCHAGWVGESCGELDLLPVEHPYEMPAYGTAPTATEEGLASWGGSVVADPHDDHLFHMFAAEMSLGCGLTAWYRNSIIIHATAASPLGPFKRKEVVLQAFAHEPTVVPLPESVGGGYVMYKIGCADNATTGSNTTAPFTGLCMTCSNGTTPCPSAAGCAACPHPDQVYERECQDVLFAHSLDGPWERHNLTGFGRSEWPWVQVDLGLESHGPTFFPNGSLLTFTRSYAAKDVQPGSSVWLVAADAWNGTYRSLGQSFRENTEDTFMWRDPRGRLHALFHDMQPTTTRHVGGHAFSVNGLHWNYSSVGAYNSTVALVSGGSFTYKRRERPHLLLDKAGNPAYLTNGVVPGVAADWSFTGVYAIRGGGGG